MNAKNPEPRVLSLLSASTEIVFRLGCGHMLVGRSHGCDDPPLATSLPVATAPYIDPSAPSRDIDVAVRAQSDNGGPVYHIRSQTVTACAPTVILTQEQCRICAVTEDDVRAACSDLPAAARIVTIKPTTLDDVLGDVGRIAAALGVPARGERLVRHLRARISAVAEMTRPLAAPGRRPRVAHLEWLAPLMGSGYWIAELVEAAGGTMVHGARGGHSAVLPGPAALADADVLLLAPCGFSVARTRAELRSGALRAEITEHAAWTDLPAVRAGRVYVADGNLFFNRSSCGVAEAAEIMAECLWEDELCGLYGHHGRYWVRLSELDAFCDREGASNTPPAVSAAPVREDPPPKDISTISRPWQSAAGDSSAAHVRAQVDAIRAGDFHLAFDMNSAANQKRLGDAEAFAAVVQINSSFAQLALSGKDARALKLSPAPNTAMVATADGSTREVEVMLLSSNRTAEEIQFVFQLLACRKGESWSWKTEGVRVVC
mmetsp:Transcript_35013/g.68946  ORF Transcript_35013/g.68946 Transcript_35013/m.68946 type:complete len:489 (-) Transcript_35013:179-1645(-)